VALGLTDQMVNAGSLWETRMTYLHDEMSYLRVYRRENIHVMEASTNGWTSLLVE